MGLILPGRTTRQPQSAPRIDWSNPITRGLVLAAIPVGGSFLDCVTGVLGVPTDAVVGMPVSGNGITARGLIGTTTTTRISWPVSSTLRGGAAVASCTVLALASMPAQVDANVYAIGGNSEPNTDGSGFSLAIDSFSLAPLRGGIIAGCYYTTAGSTSTTATIGVAFAGKLCFFGYSAINPAGAANAPSNGGASGNFFAGGVAYPYSGFNNHGVVTSNRAAYLYATKNTGGGNNVNVALFLMFGRDLSPAEYKSLSDNPGQIFVSTQRRLLFDVAAGGPDVTVALTGSAATTARGTIGPSTAKAVVGSTATAAAGSVAVGSDVTVALSGQALTASRGTLVAGAALALSGQAVTASRGSVSPALAASLSGQAQSALAGLLTPARAIVITGQSATTARGSITSGTAAALAGQQGATQQGTVSPSANVTVVLAGQSITAAQGSLSAFADAHANYNGATIMRATVTNSAVTRLIDRMAGNGGTLGSPVCGATILSATSINSTGTMRSSAINCTANLL